MPTQISEIPKVFQHGETLESSELNAIISQINSTIRKLNNVETNLENHSYDVSIPITNIYCRTKKGINAINFFPQADAKRDELLDQVSNCSTTQGIKYNTTFSTVTLSENADLMNGIWTAYPQGVSESLPHEWEVSYKKLEDNSIMYMFGPVLRSNYGYSGADGDGVQYVYRLFNHELSDIERTNNTPVRPENPNSNGEFIPYGWSDEPLGPTSDYPYEYVATLKRTNSSWGSFEKISLWSIYTEDGTNGDYYARVFCRFIPTDNKLTPNRPIGGTYENPQPGSNDNIQWSLTIPAEDNNNKGPIWTSTRIFKGNNQNTQWSIPVIEADSAELDIEYSSQVEKPDPDTTLRTVPKTANPSNIWHDPSEANIDLSTMIWRAERKIKNGQYDGNWVITRIAGVKGKDGEDGWMITADPANVIITQALGNDTTQFSTVKVGFTAKKGNVAATISSLDIPIGQQALSAEFNAAIGTGDDAKKVIVNSPKTYTPQGGTAQYYTEGTFEVVVNVTDPDTGSGVTFNVTVPCYANLLGTWSEEVVGDVKTEVAKSLSYAYDPSERNVISLENLGKFIKSSTQDTSELRQKVYVDILNLTYPATSSDIDEMTVNVLAGTYKVAGEFNLANLPTGNGYLTFVGPGVDKTWDLTGGLVDSIDDEVTFTSAGVLTINAGDDVSSGNAYNILNLAIYQSQDKIAKLELTADGLTSDVNAIKAGKNLLTLTSGWEGYGGAAIQYDKKNFGVWDENSDLYSPFIRLAEGQRVCFSAYMSSYAAQSGNWYIGYGSTPPVHLSDLYDNAHIPIALTRKPGDSITVDGTAYDRYYYVLNAGTVFVDQYITFNFAGLYKLFCPQLENGNAPTAFTAGSIETSSQIKQTADAITLVVQQGYATKSELQITTDGITAEVNAIKAGKNLFSDALTGAEWYSESSIPFANHPGMTYVTVDDNGYFIPNTGHNCIAKTVTLEKGKWYAVSVELKTSTNLPFAVFNGNTYYVNQGGYLSPISSGSKRVATKFKYDDGTTGTYTCFIGFDVSNLGNNKALRYPQLEIGETATAFDAGDEEVSSRIKQTVDSIDLETGVSESTLNKAGLYLRAGQNEQPSMVKVMAGQFKVVLPPEEQGDPEEIIFGNDPSTNTMVFSGDLKTGEEDGDYYNSYYHYQGIFPDFSTGVYYEKGECVRYNNKVYRFNKDHPSGAWKTGEQIDYEEIDSDYLDDQVVNTNSIYTDGSGRLGGGHIYWNSDGSIYLGTGSVTPKGNNYKKEDFERNWYVEDGESTWSAKKDTVFDKLYGGRYASDGLRIINNFTDSEGNVNTTISLQADNTLDLSLGRIGLTNASNQGGGVSVTPYPNDQHQTSVSMSTQTGFVISRKDYNNSNDAHDDQWRQHYGSSGALTISYNTSPYGAASTIVNTQDEESNNGKDLGLKIRIKALDGNAYKGFTGEYGSMYFINGICVGPTSGFNNADPFTTPNS